jgi:BirA family biotin operon repressor/biotin-[acetyl-CoA-carboxylase] ligase
MTTSDSNINIIRVAETDSTSKELVRKLGDGVQSSKYISVLSADYQTAGRGQLGSRWEAERGKNLLFSLMAWPVGVPVGRQFRLSQAMAVAVRDALASYADGFTIKWPNDIYFGGGKVCGTIIETTWKGGMVERFVMGVGINVNQRAFLGDAPNPLSLWQIVGREMDRDELLGRVLERFAALYGLLQAGDESEVVRCYDNHLLWREGMHRYSDKDGEFEAEFVSVAPDGRLTLRDADGRERSYYFKEVKHVLKS